MEATDLFRMGSMGHLGLGKEGVTIANHRMVKINNISLVEKGTGCSQKDAGTIDLHMPGGWRGAAHHGKPYYGGGVGSKREALLLCW